MSEPSNELDEQIFHKALQLPLESRGAYLDEACGHDTGLRRELDELLMASQRTPTFLEHPVQDFDTAIRRLERGLCGQQVGPYRVERIIGHGGMGLVYLAQQTHPIQRRVALKVIRLGMNTSEVVARFERERQALAMMEHPGIAQVFDAGATPDGAPYFVMEYVDGLPITQFADKHRLGIEARLKLLLQVCQSVQHAHQRGVIHRDLKPSNLLVAETEGGYAVKVIDFGVAKAFGDKQSERGLTLMGNLVGTPRYMSPEQAGGEAVTVDTRTDVYSLGVILYELLSGALPHQSIAERQTASSEPTSLGSRFAQMSSEELATVAATRSIEARRLRTAVRGDLEWIKSKALQVDPNARYSSASELAADIRRHLSGAPIAAGPPGTLYVLSKLIRRHRAAVAALVVVFASVATAIAFIHASDRDALRRTTAANNDLVQTKSQLIVARDRAKAAHAGLLQLSDALTLEALHAEAETLYPVHPDLSDDLDRLIQKATELLENEPLHRKSLDEIRARALPYGPEAQRRNRELSPNAQRVNELNEQFNSLLSLMTVPAYRRRGSQLMNHRIEIARERDRLLPTLDERLLWEFESPDDVWHHKLQYELVEQLVKLRTHDLPDLKRRAQACREIPKTTVEDHAMMWSLASKAIGNKKRFPAFDGLELKPQVGLVPLGLGKDSGLWEFADALTGEIPRHDETGELIITEESAAVFVLLPGGDFEMGSTPTAFGSEDSKRLNPIARTDEFPVHTVHLDPFFLSKYELSQSQWERMTGETPSVYSQQLIGEPTAYDGTHPLESVTWAECNEVLPRFGMHIPTEAQWEYAARAGSDTIWPCGDDPKQAAQLYNLRNSLVDAYVIGRERPGPRLPTTSERYLAHAPIASERPNAWGFHHMIGNVSEWCADHRDPYSNPILDRTGRRSRGLLSEQYVVRGGSFLVSPEWARSAVRITGQGSANDLGVRPARHLIR